MDLETAQTTTTAKLPILKQDEYDMWRLRIDQYFQVQDYALCDVIKNGNSFIPVSQTTTNNDGTSTTLIPGPITTEEKVQKKNDVKARIITNEVNTTYGVSTANTQANPGSTQVNTASTQKTGRKITSNGSNTARYDKSKVECSVSTNWDTLQGSADNLRTKITGTRIKTALEGLKGVGFVSYNDVSPPPTGLFSPPKLDLSNSGLEEFQQPEFESYGPKTSKSVSEDIPNEVKKSPDAPLVKKVVSDDKLEKKFFSTDAKIEFVRSKQQENVFRKPVKERVVSGNNYTRVNYNCSARKAHPSAHRNMAPRAVLMKTGLRPFNTARPVNTAHPKTIVYSARPISRLSIKKDQGYVDSGCSRHMTGNMSYLSDFKEFDGGYVTFGEGAKCGRITGTEECIGAGQASKETGSSKDYILMPLWKDGLLFNSSSKNARNDEPQPSSDAGNKDDEGSGVQTRRMTKTTNEQGFIIAVYEGKTHEDLHTCLFSCFLSHKEPKKVWTLVDLPYDKRAIGIKWIYRNKKDERGIVVRNKARIKAIRLFLAYASFKDFVVYQMDVKSAFLYGKIEEEVYVCQPPGFKDLEFPDKAYTYYYQLKVNAAKYKLTTTGDVSLLEKPTESEGFEQTVDFLNDNPIKYALTVNPTIYTSCIKQFWAMAKVKIVNGEEQIQALVGKKKVIIIETSVRSDLHLEDSKYIFDHMVKNLEDEHVTTTSNDPLLNSEDRLKLTELMEPCTQLQSRVLALETTKANQALEIRSLKRKVKKLEKKANKKTHKLKRLYKIGSSTKVESSEDAGLGDQEDASKHERIIDDLDADAEVTLEISTVDPVTTDGEVVTTVGVEVSTAAITPQISMDEITLAKALIDIKTSKPKAKGIVMQEPSETPTLTPIVSTQQPSKAKDKGKAKMIEAEKPLKKKDQIMFDEEVARNLKA
uniref:Uncharacterized protein n=1 Tax=Tanacetum cinerariifolium TaxID=118510 RepID=A0A6L2LT30_TANCI|nr:hypothetical protein [Tanacetum cinerariifolium]